MRCGRLSKYKIKGIVGCFIEDKSSNYREKSEGKLQTVNAYYNEFREKILEHSLRD